ARRHGAGPGPARRRPPRDAPRQRTDRTRQAEPRTVDAPPAPSPAACLSSPGSLPAPARLMCGIVGGVAPVRLDPAIVERMRERLAHRGPDAAGLWSTRDGRVCLGHRRLAIVDLSPDANQPMLSADGRLAVTLNGEIYNFRALRTELERLGSAFRTSSDTEV